MIQGTSHGDDYDDDDDEDADDDDPDDAASEDDVDENDDGDDGPGLNTICEYYGFIAVIEQRIAAY